MNGRITSMNNLLNESKILEQRLIEANAKIVNRLQKTDWLNEILNLLEENETNLIDMERQMAQNVAKHSNIREQNRF